MTIVVASPDVVELLKSKMGSVVHADDELTADAAPHPPPPSPAAATVNVYEEEEIRPVAANVHARHLHLPPSPRRSATPGATPPAAEGEA